MSSLSTLLQRSADPALEVARCWDPRVRADTVICWAEFQRDVAGLKDRIESEAVGAWVLLTDDAYAFAVGLFALWHAGCEAISPPNRQLSSLRSLYDRAAGILTDRPECFPAISSIHPLDDAGHGDPDSLTVLDPEARAMELFTSGTTGGEKPVLKQLCHLENEVRELSAIWGATVGGTTFFSAASHQHLYGLLFGVLWPLSEGRPFQRYHILQPGELLPRMREGGDCVLASVPTHLKRFARHNQTPSIRGKCRAVFSSGGPLAAETAYEVADAMGASPIEVLGSTETGGIAWRVQKRDELELSWTPFSVVQVSGGDEELLRVRSPFVSVDCADGYFETGDRASFRADGTFDLMGRADYVVKVGEKRLDLTRMELDLRERPSIDEVALTTIDREGDVRVAAVVVPSQEGWHWVRQKGQQRFVRALGLDLGDAWDPVLHPRYWRVVSALPTNAMGKISQKSLRELFRASPTDWALSDRPWVLEEFRGADLLERSCRVPPDLRCFAGHFPGNPIVPGVLQLDWAMELANELAGTSIRPDAIESLKFLSPLFPEDSFRITVHLISDQKVEFEIFGDGVAYARGRVRIRPRDQATP